MKRILLFVAVIVEISACKKGGTTNNPPASSSCRIIKIDVTPYTPDYFILKYDDAGKLTTIEDGPGGIMRKDITYADHSYTMMEYNGPSLIRTAKADLTSDNKIIIFTEKRYEANILRHTTTRSFAYFTTGELKRVQVDIDSTINYLEYTYDWSNGNLVHEMLNGKPGPPLTPTLHTYNEYDVQKQLPAGNELNAYDLTRFEELLTYGRILIKNKNPLIKQTYSQQNTDDFFRLYTYEFDGKGNVSRITGTRPNTSNGTYTIAYSYDCH
jgi:hypothetical protein